MSPDILPASNELVAPSVQSLELVTAPSAADDNAEDCGVHSDASSATDTSCLYFLVLFSTGTNGSSTLQTVFNRCPKNTEYLWCPLSNSRSAPAPIVAVCPFWSSDPPATELPTPM